MSLLFGTTRYDFVSFESETYGDNGIMTVIKHFIPSLIEKLFRRKKESITIQFVGSGTVWRSYPDFIRQDTNMECLLTDYWSKWRWENRKLRNQHY